jgi:hemolysin activation/secretion protein
MAFLRPGLCAVALLATSQNALAQEPIGAGGTIQQIPQVPLQPRSAPDLPIHREAAPAAPETAGPRFVLNKLHVTGETRYSEAELIAVTNFKPGTEFSLGELRALVSKITDFYNTNGYIVAQAYLPPQDIKDRAVTIAVIEGRYGRISLGNQTNISDNQLVSVLDGLSRATA